MYVQFAKKENKPINQIFSPLFFLSLCTFLPVLKANEVKKVMAQMFYFAFIQNQENSFFLNQESSS